MGMWCSSKYFKTPIWANPSAPPPLKASPIRGRFWTGSGGDGDTDDPKRIRAKKIKKNVLRTRPRGRVDLIQMFLYEPACKSGVNEGNLIKQPPITTAFSA